MSATAQNAKRDHHYVPRFYLRAWCGSDGLLWAHWRNKFGTLKQRKKSPKSVACVRDLYTIRHVGPLVNSGSPESVERAFEVLENEAAPIHQKLVTEQAAQGLSVAERTVWARFLLSLDNRGPSRLGQLDADAGLFAKRTTDDMRARAQQSEQHSRLEEALAEFDAIALGRNELRRALLRFAAAPAHVSTLLSHHWLLIDAGRGPEYITTDRPVFYLDTKETGRVAMFCPISPQTLFVSTPNAEFRDDRKLNAMLPMLARLLILQTPPTQVFSHGRLDSRSLFKLQKTWPEK
ncbi:MAG: hypothetical protein JWN04_3839 [Myxococcaceae bacterium]|nr:hypothetical protein [Myxococcaceae bacterium]